MELLQVSNLLYTIQVINLFANRKSKAIHNLRRLQFEGDTAHIEQQDQCTTTNALRMRFENNF